MNPEIKARWVAALRSGEYTQARGHLRKAADIGMSHCCLGVLCDLYNKETDNEWIGPIYASLPSYLPIKVLSWSGIKCENPYVCIGKNAVKLSTHNDHGKTFAQIADAIEKQL